MAPRWNILKVLPLPPNSPDLNQIEFKPHQLPLATCVLVPDIVPQDTFRGLLESIPQWFGTDLEGHIRPPAY